LFIRRQEAATGSASGRARRRWTRVLGAAFLAIRRVDAEQGMAKLALQVWGEAVRSPAVAETLRTVTTRLDAPLPSASTA
jgi:hypothetical protein